MKKILLILTIVLSSILYVNAEELPTIEVGSYQAIIGEEITIPVTIKNNTGFSFIGFKIEYDTDSLEYVDSQIIGLDDFVLKQITLNPNNVIVMYAINLDKTKLMQDDGKISELKFKVKENAKDTTLKLNVTDYGNSDLETFTTNAIDGKVTIYKEITKDDKINTADLNTNDNNYEWKSSNPDIAEIDEKGNVTFKKNGEVTLTQTDEEGNVINSKTYKVVNKISQNKDNNSLNIKTIILIVGVILIIVIAIIVFVIFKKRSKKVKIDKKEE